MVDGIESFRKAFKDFPDCYTVIGGAACSILMEEESLEFRATHDIDMILILEDRQKEFGDVFWKFIKDGEYKCGWKTSESVHFYRFTEPKPGYPVQIELFSRRQDYHLNTEQGIVPIHMDDDASSLSDILLNDDFYNFMMKGRKVINGITVLGAEYLVPFKMYAWLDLTERKSRGEFVKDKDLRKHKNDVFRLQPIVNESARITLEGLVKDKTEEFLSVIANENMELNKLGSLLSLSEAIELYRKIYQLG